VCLRQRRPTGFAGSGQTFFNITYIPGAGGWGGGTRGRRPCAFFFPRRRVFSIIANGPESAGLSCAAPAIRLLPVCIGTRCTGLSYLYNNIIMFQFGHNNI